MTLQLLYDNKPMQSIRINFLDIDFKPVELEFDAAKKIKLPKCSMSNFIPIFFDFKKVTRVSVAKESESVKIEFQITKPAKDTDMEIVMEFSFIIPSDETDIKIYPLGHGTITP